MADLKLQFAKTPEGPLPEWPLDADMIREGNPVARGAVLMQTADKKLSAGFWECSEGKFDYHHTFEEFFRVIEGEVTVTEKCGQSYTLGPGDTLNLPLGIDTSWHVKKPVRKFFVLRTAEPFEA